MLIFETFLKRKSDPNIHLNAPFKKKFSGGRPQTPIRAWRFATCNFRNLKKKSWPPCQLLATPLIITPIQ